MLLLSWLLLGTLLGIAAAQKRGFSVVAGGLGGLLLGPLAFLMFWVSGVTRGDDSRRCPHCAEFVKVQATICKHCRQLLTADVQTA